MFRSAKALKTELISVEPAIISPENKVNLTEEEMQALIESEPEPYLVFSFGDMDGPVNDLAVSIENSRKIITDTLMCLADIGDETARKILLSIQNILDEEEECEECDGECDGGCGCEDESEEQND